MKKEKWLVAVSGGPDSMALLHVLQQESYDLYVAHVNYHQRPESNEEERMVKDYCLQHGLSFYSVDFDVEVDGNFQHIARNFRYQFFSDLVIKFDLCGVMVGHHYDDHIETYLIQKERHQKSDAIGLSTNAMIKGVVVRRPLLKYTKEELIEMCHQNHVPYRIDASNSNPKYTRNRIRLQKKDLKTIEEAMKKDQMKLEEDNKKIDFVIGKLGFNKVYYREYETFDEMLRIAYLRFLLLHRGIEVFHFREKFFKELDRQIMSGKGKHKFGLKTLYMETDYFIISEKKDYEYTLETINEQIFDEFKFAAEGETNQRVSFNEDDFPITIRNVRPGDSIEMKYGRKKVSRYFIDNKIPHHQRENWLVIENAVKECIYVMGMGCDVHHYANNYTTYVIELNLL